MGEDSVSGSEWHLARGDKKYGPISDNELFRLAEQGNLKGDDLLWKRGFEDWKAASSIPGLLSPPVTPTQQPVTAPQAGPQAAPKPTKRSKGKKLAVGISIGLAIFISLFVSLYVTGKDHLLGKEYVMWKRYVIGSLSPNYIGGEPGGPVLHSPGWRGQLTPDQISEVENTIRSALKDPDSARFGSMAAFAQKDGTLIVCGWVNAKNSLGGYTGDRPFRGRLFDPSSLYRLGETDDEAERVLKMCREDGLF